MAKFKEAVTGSMSEETGEAQTVKQSKKPKCCDPRHGNCTRKDWHARLAEKDDDEES
jgi:hypothetical protein